MDNMNKQKPIATDISQWNNCTEIIYPVCRKTPCFSYGDIRYFHRIYASN